MWLRILLALLLPGTWVLPLAADTAGARCDIYAAGSDRLDKMIPCSFGQRQGYVTITRSDGVTHDLAPVGDSPGNFLDQDGRPVYRQGGLGDLGQIFRFPDESVYVYWDTSALHPNQADNPTDPFSTTDYDATTLLPCHGVGESGIHQCPAGIRRMENAQASIVVQGRDGAQFTINFLTDAINTTDRQVDARLEGDTWIVTIDGSEVYEVPLAPIEGD